MPCTALVCMPQTTAFVDLLNNPETDDDVLFAFTLSADFEGATSETRREAVGLFYILHQKTNYFHSR